MTTNLRILPSGFKIHGNSGGGCPIVETTADNLLADLEKLLGFQYNHLSTIIGYDTPEGVVLVYPLSKIVPYEGASLFLKMNVADSEVPSVTSIFPGANVYENEIHELLGVDFVGIEYGSLLLPDGFPEHVFPLRKRYKSTDIRFEMDKVGVGFDLPDPLPEDSRYTISVGPQHPTHKEPIRFQFYITGEVIEEVDLRLGFNHRGIEKALEEGSWNKNLYLIERICGICSAAHQIAYSVAAERLAGVEEEVPRRAQWIRTLVAELERIHSHMLWYGVLAHDAGYDMMFHISWRDREEVMDILEELTGNRVNYSMMALGGVRRDISDQQRMSISRKLTKLTAAVREHISIMKEEVTLRGRLEGVGGLSKEVILAMNAVGPTARGAGVDFDLRRDYPYIAYDELPMQVHTYPSGDVYDSLLVRLDETLTSLDMCEYILQNLPEGDIRTRFRSKLPEGEAHARVEAPRGEDIHYIRSTGGRAPDRHKVRAPTFANITSLLHRFKSMKVADIPLIIRLIDPCIGCMERVEFIDLESGDRKETSGKEVLRWSRGQEEFSLFR